MNCYRSFFHPRKTARELEAAEAELVRLAAESAAHARNAQSLREELQEARDETAGLHSRLGESEKSADAVTEEMMRTRAKLEEREREVRELRAVNARLDEENRIAVREQDEQLRLFEARLTKAEQMKSTYQARIAALKKELADLRAEREADEDADWFTLPPEI